MRIAMVAACPFPLARGTPVRILRMAEGLADLGHEVHVATYHLGSGPVAPNVIVHRIRDVPSYRKLSPGPTLGKLTRVDPLLTRLLKDLLRSKAFDVIHAHHYEGLLVSALARRGTKIPVVYDAHTLLMSELPFYPLGLPQAVKRGLGGWLDGVIPRMADHTVCVTETIRNKLISVAGMQPDKISVITNGVEYEHFDPAPYRDQPRSPGRRVIFTGNLAEYQGIDHLLRAFAIVAKQIPDATLTIATESPFTPYEGLARSLEIRERIEMISSPKFSELPALLARSDVAVNPRVDGDGVPVKLLNYMAAGCAVVSFDSSAPGVVHGQTGWLARSGDDAALAAGIIALLSDRETANALGIAARRYVADNCRWSIVAQRCTALYQQLLGARA